jgi:hypothetical protein
LGSAHAFAQTRIRSTQFAHGRIARCDRPGGDNHHDPAEERLEPERTNLVCRYKPEFGGGRTQSYTVALDVSNLKLYAVATGKPLMEARVTGPRKCPDATTVEPGEDTVSSLTDVAGFAQAVRRLVVDS